MAIIQNVQGSAAQLEKEDQIEPEELTPALEKIKSLQLNERMDSSQKSRSSLYNKARVPNHQPRESNTTESVPDFEQLMRGINFKQGPPIEDLTMNEIKNNFMDSLRNSEYNEDTNKKSREDLELKMNLQKSRQQNFSQQDLVGKVKKEQTVEL